MLTQYKLTTEAAKILRRRCGAYIKGLRLDADLTQAQVAKALGYEYYTMISQIESGKARVPPEDYEKWATILRVDVKEFAKKILSFMDPYTFHILFGGEHPIVSAHKDENAQHKRSLEDRAGPSRHNEARAVIDNVRGGGDVR